MIMLITMYSMKHRGKKEGKKLLLWQIIYYMTRTVIHVHVEFRHKPKTEY